MKLEKILYTRVKRDGTFDNPPDHISGVVETSGVVKLDNVDGRPFLLLLLPRSLNGIVEGITAEFENQAEFTSFIVSGKLKMENQTQNTEHE